MTSEYKLTDAFFKAFKFKVLRVTVPLMLIAVSAGWYIAGASVEPVNLIVFGVAIAALLPISIGRTLKRQIKSYRTFRIELTNDRISREQDGLPRLEIPLAEVISLHEVAGRALVIRGKGPHQVLTVPIALERYGELRTQLAKIRSIEQQPVKNGIPLLVTASLIPLVLMVALYRSESVSVIMISGTLLIGILVYCGVSIARSPHIDQRVKRASWAMVLVILSVVARMWFALAHD